MRFYIRRPRQVIGLIYILIYIFVFITFTIVRKDDQSWLIDPRLTAMVMLWFLLSLSVKVSMLNNRIFELLNLSAFFAFMSIGFIYRSHPGPYSSIENFCYFLSITGGPLCDLFDFFCEGAASRPEDTV